MFIVALLLHYLFTKDLFIIKELENVEIISQVVRVSEVLDQNGDRVL